MNARARLIFALGLSIAVPSAISGCGNDDTASDDLVPYDAGQGQESSDSSEDSTSDTSESTATSEPDSSETDTSTTTDVTGKDSETSTVDSGADASGADASGADASGADASGADASGAGDTSGSDTGASGEPSDAGDSGTGEETSDTVDGSAPNSTLDASEAGADLDPDASEGEGGSEPDSEVRVELQLDEVSALGITPAQAIAAFSGAYDGTLVLDSEPVELSIVVACEDSSFPRGSGFPEGAVAAMSDEEGADSMYLYCGIQFETADGAFEESAEVVVRVTSAEEASAYLVFTDQTLNGTHPLEPEEGFELGSSSLDINAEFSADGTTDGYVRESSPTVDLHVVGTWGSYTE